MGSAMKRVVFIVLLVGICGLVCAEGARHNPAAISFNETNPEGQRVRDLTFDLTDEPAKTCMSGTWKAARAIKDPGNYTKNPAYRLERGELEILLINGPCDSYDSYMGDVKDRVFSGEHVEYGMRFHKTLGKVTGVFSK